jgi:hypothetical protein
MGISRREQNLPSLRQLDARTSAPSNAGDLWLTHVTMAGWADEILRSKKIETRECKALRKKLAYFFALKPAYGQKTDLDKSDQVSRFPAVFIIDPLNLVPPYHVYPFDTGGALAGTFGDCPDPTVFLEDYELSPNLEAAEGHISWAFGSRAAYFDGELKSELPSTLQSFDKVGRSYVAIARLDSTRVNAPDGRSCAIEVAYSSDVPLLNNCRAIVLPKQHIEDEDGSCSEVLELIHASGIEELYYDWQPNEYPRYYADQITNIVRDFLQSKGILSE